MAFAWENPPLQMVTDTVSSAPASPSRSPILAIAILTLQVVATTLFVIDGITEMMVQMRDGLFLAVLMETLIASALIIGVALGVRQTRELLSQHRRNANALAIARGALFELIHLRFAEWGLSASEADVALFAIKGCSVPEIARLRNAASGTVRSQLSQIYAKAGVTSQSTLISLFIDELLQLEPN